MSIAKAMILFGALLIYAGWKNLSVAALARGDNSTAKGPVTAGGSTPSASSTSSSTSAPSPPQLPSTPVPGGRI